jgi:hypothetical protein
MDRDVDAVDRAARLAVGPLAVLAGLGTLLEMLPAGSLVGTVPLVAGAILLGTGAVQRCPGNILSASTAVRVPDRGQAVAGRMTRSVAPAPSGSNPRGSRSPSLAATSPPS